MAKRIESVCIGLLGSASFSPQHSASQFLMELSHIPCHPDNALIIQVFLNQRHQSGVSKYKI